jgi:hypothetical protein
MSIPRILKLGQCRKRSCSSAFFSGWRKLCTGLAGIGIDAEQQELRRDCAEIGRAIQQDLWRLVSLECHVLVAEISRGRSRKYHIYRLIYVTFHWLERDNTGLTDRCRHPSGRPQAVAMAGEINYRLKSGHVRHARERRETGAHVFVSDKIEMQSGFRDVLKPDRHVPRLRWLDHELPRFAKGRRQLEWRMATGSENASCRPGRCQHDESTFDEVATPRPE